MPDLIVNAYVQLDSGGGQVPMGGSLEIAGGAFVRKTPANPGASLNDSEGDSDGIWTYGETLIDTDAGGNLPWFFANPTGNNVFQTQFVGTVTFGGHSYPVLYEGAGDAHFVLFYDVAGGPTGGDAADGWFAATGTSSFNVNNVTFTECFAEGTKVSTRNGEKMVEDLQIGDVLRTNDGGGTRVVWVGYKDIFPLIAGEKDEPVRIRAGALADNMPSEDLIVTADHALMLDGYLVNASALVNHDTIDFVPAKEMQQLRVYHVETEAHDVILANGAPSETFIDYVNRAAFDNYAEYLELYGAERIIPEMDRPRISSSRLVPQAIKARLGSAAARIKAA